MITTPHDVTTTSPLGHDEAMTLQAAELEITLEMLRTLTDEEWRTNVPDCPAWDLRTLYLHVLGACEGAAMPEMMHQMQAAMRRRRREGGPLEANLSAVQVADRSRSDRTRRRPWCRWPTAPNWRRRRSCRGSPRSRRAQWPSAVGCQRHSGADSG
jgi:hypothetical protein